jgi:superoxide dismutase, Fe-Mn family
MPFDLPPLPYARDALEPFVSAQTLTFHHGEHHRTYVETLNKLIAGTPYAALSLDEIIQGAADKESDRKIFNNAAQAWNHAFFWNCMKPQGGGAPEGELARRIAADFGSLQSFCDEFKKAAVGQFGSGWAWLVLDAGTLKVLSTHDAMTPVVQGQTPLLTCDVWEHAYYLDYQNRRADFVQAFLHNLVNWRFAAEQLALQGEGSSTGARDYDKAAAGFAKSGKVERQAKAAKAALEGPEGEELQKAEAAGKRHAAGEDRLLNQRRTGSR